MVTRRTPGRTLSGEELDPVLLGKHLSQTSGQGDGGGGDARKALHAPAAHSRRGGRRKAPKKTNSGNGTLDAFVEEMNASFQEDVNVTDTDPCAQTVDSRELNRAALSPSGPDSPKRGGRRPSPRKAGES